MPAHMVFVAMLKISLAVISLITFLFLIHELAFGQNGRKISIFAAALISSVVLNLAIPCDQAKIESFFGKATKTSVRIERLIYG